MDARIHPYIVHFPVSLILTATVLFLLATAFRQRSWSPQALAAGRWSLWIGAAFALASIGTGFIDYISNRCDESAIAATVLHRRSGAVTWWSSLIAGIAAWRTRARYPGPLLIAWLLGVAAAALVATRLGTSLTYEHGLGVEGRWPEGAPLCFELERGNRS